MNDRTAFALGMRYTHNQALRQMLGPATMYFGLRTMIEPFDLPMQSGPGFYLINLMHEYWSYGKSRGRLHSLMEYSKQRVVEFYE